VLRSTHAGSFWPQQISQQGKCGNRHAARNQPHKEFLHVQSFPPLRTIDPLNTVRMRDLTNKMSILSKWPLEEARSGPAPAASTVLSSWCLCLRFW
jgi:hypothetical protein